jgi:hypothetical protein
MYHITCFIFILGTKNRQGSQSLQILKSAMALILLADAHCNFVG